MKLFGYKIYWCVFCGPHIEKMDKDGSTKRDKELTNAIISRLKEHGVIQK